MSKTKHICRLCKTTNGVKEHVILYTVYAFLCSSCWDLVTRSISTSYKYESIGKLDSESEETVLFILGWLEGAEAGIKSVSKLKSVYINGEEWRSVPAQNG